jgi:hypothetical protein
VSITKVKILNVQALDMDDELEMINKKKKKQAPG